MEIVNLDKDLREEIIKIISFQKSVEKVILFGSRATHTSRQNSDIDLAVFGPNLSDRDMSFIRDSLEENIKTPLKFDVIHFDTLTKKNLKNDILFEGICLYDAKTNKAAL